MGVYSTYPSESSGSAGVSSLNNLTGDIVIAPGSNVTFTTVGNTITINSTGGGGGSGTVTSVALADSTNIFNITGSPVTASGTLTLSSLKSQTANTFLAAPNGSAGSPTFRAILAADVPTLNQNTTGTAANITATSNSTLTTLSALSLPGSQVSGNITGNAANISATSNSTLTTLSALSLPGAQVTGNIAGNAANITATSNSTLVTLSALSLPGSQVTGNITGNSAGFTGNLAGDVTGTQGATAIAATTVTGKVLTGYTVGSNVAIAATDSILTAFEKTQAQLNASTGAAITSLTSDVSATGPGAAAATVNSVGGATAASIASATALVEGSKAQNSVLAGPSSGGAGAASFRSLVSADIPSLSSLYLALTGGTMSGAINMGASQINNLANPTSAQDAATKSYVDAAISGLTWKGPVQAYANSNVPLTGSTPLVIDGYTVANGDLLLLAAQSTASQDGEYAAAITGGAYVLTANGLPNAIGDAWLVSKGTVFANSAFVATAVVPAATFIEFAGPTAYSFTAPLQLTGNVVSITQSSTSTAGYLSAADFTTFNSKQAAGNYITALTGDASASGPGSAALTLATVNTNVGSFGSSTSIPSFTVNGKGLITAASGNVVIAPAGTLSGTTLNSTVVNSSLTSLGTITSGTWNGTTIAVANGGTGQTSASAGFAALSPLTTIGDIIFESTGPAPARLPIGSSNQVLTVVAGVPAWVAPAVASVNGSTGAVTVNAINQLTGDVAAGPASGSASAASTIQSNVVSNSKLAQMATLTIKGNNTGGTANASDLTVAQVNAILPVFTSTLNGLAPLSGGGTTNYLRADGTWAAPAGVGTVTSVALAAPSIFTVSGSPVTSSGTLTLAYSGTALPIANGGTNATSATAAFNNLSPMTTAGDVIIGGASGAGTRLGIGSTNQVLTVVSGAPAWAAVPSATLAVTSKTTTYTATTSDGLILCNASGAAFTVTLPAASNVGFVVRIQKTDSSFNQVTIAAGSGDTIEGASTTTSASQYESVVLVAAGSNIWYVLDRTFPNAYSTTAYPLTLSNIGTFTGTISCRRVGSNLEGVIAGSTGTTSASIFSINLPSGLTIATGQLPTQSNSVPVGVSYTGTNSTQLIYTSGAGTVVFYDGSTNNALYASFNTGAATSTFVKTNANMLFNSGNIISMQFSIPITGWN